jgi:uncharacterized membrane protein
MSASHHHHDLFENRKQFQLERLILFSDAVFAIAITLLVIEIKVPEIHQSSNIIHDLKEALSEKFAEFFGLVLSFAVIGQFWHNHHRLFGSVNNYNPGLIWLNLHMLFWIILVPFTSGLNSRYGNLDFVWQVYSLNLFMIGMSLFFLYRYIGNPKHNLSYLAQDPLQKRFSQYRSLATSSIFLLGGLLAMVSNNTSPFLSNLSRFIYFLIPIVLTLVTKRYHRLRAKKGHL